MHNEIIELKAVQENDDFQVEYSIIPEYETDQTSELYSKAQSEIDLLNNRIGSLENKVAELNSEIDNLTNHADGVDYTIAVASGILAGLIDSFFVGELDLEWGSKKVNDFVIDNAKKQKIDEKVNGALERAKEKGILLDMEKIQEIRNNIEKEFDTTDPEKEQKVLKKAIKFFEDRYKLPGDNVFQNKGNGITTYSHHLDDLAHHPSLLGLLCSIIMQFTHRGLYQNSDGQTMIIKDEYGLYGSDLKSKLFAGTVNWFWHLVSDVAGSHKTAGAGMGIPGPILSLAKEIAMIIPGINKTPLPQLLKKLFEDKHFDFRMELSLAHGAAKQAIPVIINEVIVRGFFFIRRIYLQFKETNDLKMVDIHKALPFKNRTIARMLTISSGTFVAVDLADAAIRSAVRSKGFAAEFARNFILRVNFVGIGRFAVAVFIDAGMEIKKNKKEYERINTYNQILLLSSVKLQYKQVQKYSLLNDCAKKKEELWCALTDSEREFCELVQLYEKAVQESIDTYYENRKSIKNIGDMVDDINKHNPGLIDELLDIL